MYAKMTIIFCCLLPFTSFAQFQQFQILPQQYLDSLGKITSRYPLQKKRFGRAALQLGVAELTPWVIDRYLRNAEVYRVSFQTVGNNLKPSSWRFDNDPVGTNQFGHPYHGSQFFSAYRANGYSFWESAPAALAGSYLWETAAENQAPSTNDLINTSFGGIVLGEMTYRLSNKIVNNRTRGLKRQVSEVFALIVNPMNGLTRIMDGKWGKVMANSAERDSSVIGAELDIGMRKIGTGHSGANLGWYGHIKLLYGTPYENYRVPFSNITINTEFGKDDSTKVNIFSVYGSLAGWQVGSSAGLRNLAVLSANYDYIHNQSFFYSAQSVKLNFLSELKLGKKISIHSNFGAGPVILGAVPNSYPYGGRNYDYGIGTGVHAGGSLSIAGHFFYTLNYRGGWLKTIDGNAAHYFLHTLSSELRYQVADPFSFCVEGGYFTLHGYYKVFDNVNREYPYLRISARYGFTIK